MANYPHFILLLSLTIIITFSTSSRVLTPLSSSQIQKLPYTPGPIHTNGQNFTKVCDPARFTITGLRMEDFAYCNASLPYSVRVKDLIGRMTISEKFKNLNDLAPGAPRIGLPHYNWWSEALHGVASSQNGTFFGDIVKGATVFPTPILTAASFNEPLWNSIGQVVSTEARAMYNLGHAGLTFWSPNINVARDPRWGRTLETPGEDPYVTSRYAVNYVRGLQDVDGSVTVQDPNTRSLKVAACCKHYTAYDLDSWMHGMIVRQEYDARVTEQDMVETFNRPFETCVREGDSSSIMCSFNKVNGIPVCADARLMSQTFRKEWNLHGYIVADCDSVEVITERQKWLHDTPEAAIAETLKAGLDLDCGWGKFHFYQDYGESAIKQGRVRETDVDNALTNLYTVLMRLGFFDGNDKFQNLGLSDICSKEHTDLSAEAARQGTVLLKNINNKILPFDSTKFKKIALIGPHANATEAMRGNYAGDPCKYITPLEAFQAEALVQVDIQKGCTKVACTDVDLNPVIGAVKKADASVFFFGLDLSKEREEFDKDGIHLPAGQVEIITKAAEASKGPVVLIIMSGTCVDLSFAEKNPKIGAILWVGYPGEQGGRAIADVVFGRYNPAGRLPLTWYNSNYVYKLPMTSMQLRPNDQLGYPGRTYKFYNGPLQYPFGHGLSYTTFNYTLKSSTTSISTTLSPLQTCKHLTLKPKVTPPPCPAINIDENLCADNINFTVIVTNTGKLDGDHVLLVYSKPPLMVDDAPIKQVVAFQRVFVKAGQALEVDFSLNACKALGLVEKTAFKVLPSGEHTIVVGHGQVAISFHVTVDFKY